MSEGSTPARGESLEHLRLYLSKRLPSRHLAGFLPRLAAEPPDQVAREIHEWAKGQTGPADLASHLSRGLRRFLVLQTGAGETDRHDDFMRAVTEALRARASVEDPLKDWVAPTPAGAPNAPRPSVPPSPPAPAGGPRRLTLILDRLDAAAGEDQTERSKASLVGEAVLTATLLATSPAELEARLEDLRRRGLVEGPAQLLRILADALPPWPLPDLSARSAPAAAAIEKVVTLAPGPEPAERCFRELVDIGVETFNRGRLERAELAFGVVERLLDRGAVDAKQVEELRARGHESLDLELLRRIIEGQDGREMPRTILRFFRVFDPGALLDKLRSEPARARRRLLLAFLEAHGGDGRHVVFERLRRRPEDTFDVFLLRNLVHLLRRIPDDASSWMPRHELARVVRFLVPESPPFLVREVLAYLSERRHPVSEQVLVQFVRTLEDRLLSPPRDEKKGGPDLWQSHLGDVVTALARHGSPRAWGAVVDHGLRREAELGEASARLVALGTEDLSGQPDLVARLVGAARAELPKGALARPTLEQTRRIEHIVAALAATRTGDALDLLETLAERFPDVDFGQWASRALASGFEGTGAVGFDTPVDMSLSGDLRVFGLPTLMQNLGDSKVTGVLRLFDAAGRRAATIEFERGRFRSARHGTLRGAEVVYQLLERPFQGNFGFVPRSPGDEDEAASRPEVAELLLEGFRRHDELKRAAVLVPEDARFEATDISPPAVPGEEDIDLVAALWEAVVAGTTPEDCEKTLPADPYRIRRCLAHWVEEGALRLSPAPPRR
jgi:hypothetical protein